MTSPTTVQRLMDSSDATGTPAAADRAFAHQLMETVAIPIFVLDTAARVMLWNRACERLTGVPAREIIGTRDHWRSFFDERRPTLADLLIEERAAQAARIQPLHAPADDAHLSAESWCDMPRVGRRRYLAADASPIHDDRGRLVAVVQTLRDLTDEKLAQIALEQRATSSVSRTNRRMTPR